MDSQPAKSHSFAQSDHWIAIYAVLLTLGANALFFGFLKYAKLQRPMAPPPSGRVMLLTLDSLPQQERESVMRFLDTHDPGILSRSDNRYGYAHTVHAAKTRNTLMRPALSNESYFTDPPPGKGPGYIPFASRQAPAVRPLTWEAPLKVPDYPDHPYVLVDGLYCRDVNLPVLSEDQLKKLAPSVKLRLTLLSGKTKLTRFEVLQSSGNVQLDEQLGLLFSHKKLLSSQNSSAIVEVHFKDGAAKR